MSIFNNDDFIDDTDNLTLDGLISLDIFHKKDEQITVNYGLQLNSNTFIDDKIIEKSEMKQLENIDVNIKTKLTELSSNIGGVYTNNNSYSGSNIYLGSSSFNQMTLTTNGITKNLDSLELSQLDGITSNIQSSLNNKINKIVNPVLNNLVSMDISGNCFNNDVKITTDNDLNITSDKIIPSSTSIKNYVDNKINNLSYQSVVGEGINLYFSNTTNNLSGYEDLLYNPDTSTEDIEVITLNNNRVLLHSYATSSLNRTIIPSGIYSFHFYCYINDNVSLSRFEIELYKIDLSNNLTQIGTTILSPDVNNVNVGNLTFNYTLQNNVSCNYTDKFIVKIFGFSNVSTKTILLYFYHSGSRYNSFISTPFIYKHNDLSNLDDVNGNYHHLTLLQKQKATQYSSTTNDGILNTSDFNIFNNKENYINPSTVNHYYRGDKSFQILNKGSVGLVNCDNTSDLNKPISTATQLSLNLKNDIINSSTNLSVNTISDITGNLRTSINNLTNKLYQVLFVAYQFGLDTNSGLVMNSPKKLIQTALDDVVSNSGVNIIILPFVYPENITINKQNISIASIIYEKGGLCNITGDVNITTTSSSVRITGLSLVNLNISGNCSVYIDNCKISGILNKTGTGYMEINNSSLSGQILLNSNSVNNFLNNNIGGIVSNNVSYNSLQCNFSNNLISGISLNLNSGVWGFNNSVIYSTSSTTFSLTGNGIYLYLSNMSMLNPDNNPSKISLTNTYYSINNTFYNKASSVFTTSTKLNRTQYNEIMNIDTIYLNSFLNVNSINITPVQLSYLDGITSNLQQQLNNQISLSNNNSFTGITTFNNTTSMPQLLTKNNNSNIGIGDVILKPLINLTTGSYNICIGQDAGRFITTGNYNTILGEGCGDNISVGSENILIGKFCDVTTNNTSNSIAIGRNVLLRGSNLIQIGTSNETTEIDGPIKLKNTTTISGNTTISGTLNLTNSNSTAITQLSVDNSTKIATTEFVKLFSAPLKYTGIVVHTNSFTFGKFKFVNSGGSLCLSTITGTPSVNIYYSSDLVYLGSNVGAYMASGLLTDLLQTPASISSSVFFVNSPGRTLNGHFYNLTNGEYFRFSVMVINSLDNILYYVEKLI